MVTLLLTSIGLQSPTMRKKVIELLGAKLSRAMVLYVPTASQFPGVSQGGLEYIKQTLRELVNLGISENNIIIFDANKPPKDLKHVDAVYVCGGNTFYLLHKLRETGFDKIIMTLVKSGALYVGESAGSVLAGPDIGIATPFDPNDVGLKDTTGLKLTDLIITPHFQNKDDNVIKKFEKENKVKVTRITDTQGVLEIDGRAKIID